MNGTRLYRSVDNRMIGGVASGLANYFNADTSLIRLLWVLAIFFAGTGVLAYIIAWIIIPEEPYLSGANSEGATNNETSSSETPVSKNYSTNDSSTNNRRFSYFGIFLVLLGVFFLLKALFPYELSRYFWPFLLICLGVLLLLPRRGYRK